MLNNKNNEKSTRQQKHNVKYFVIRKESHGKLEEKLKAFLRVDQPACVLTEDSGVTFREDVKG